MNGMRTSEDGQDAMDEIRSASDQMLQAQMEGERQKGILEVLMRVADFMPANARFLARELGLSDELERRIK